MNSIMTIATEIAPKMGLPMSDGAEQTTYAIAGWLMECVEWILNLFGLGHHPNLVTILYGALVFALALVVGMAVKWVVVAILNKIGPHVKSDLYGYLVKDKFFTKFCRIIPALVFLIMIQFTMTTRASLSSWLTRLTWIYIIFIVCSALCTLTDSIWNHVDQKANKRHLPLNGVVQLVKLVAWVIAVIVICAVLFNRSPASLLAGLGAFAAVLMLIFKDSILGVVAGVQLAENDSLHVGDWIAVPGTDANGTVMEVGLTAVKILNWDKTVSTVPPYNLVTGGFKNYRNMSLSNTRRIQRSYMIDADSVVQTDDNMLAEFAEIPLLKDWIEKKIEQRKAGKVENSHNSAGLVDGSIESNLGVFRAYMKLWLDTNPSISSKDVCFVTTLAQTAGGIPLQFYCFTTTSAWTDYEAIQASLFEHVATMLYRFNLYTFENASGRDEVIDGYLSPGKNPEPIFGIPYPFFRGTGTPEQPGIPPEGYYPPVTPAPAVPTSSSQNTDASSKSQRS